jgi:hypothetical protein
MANDLLTKDLITYDPLSATTRRERTALLGTSILGVALVKVPLIPEKLAFLGIEFAKLEQEKLVNLYALVVAYYFVAFCVYALTDYVAWRRQELINLHEYDEQRNERQRDSHVTMSELIRKQTAQREQMPNDSPAYRGFASYWFAFFVARARAAFEFVLPIGFSLYAVFVLLSYK